VSVAVPQVAIPTSRPATPRFHVHLLPFRRFVERPQLLDQTVANVTSIGACTRISSVYAQRHFSIADSVEIIFPPEFEIRSKLNSHQTFFTFSSARSFTFSS